STTAAAGARTPTRTWTTTRSPRSRTTAPPRRSSTARVFSGGLSRRIGEAVREETSSTEEARLDERREEARTPARGDGQREVARHHRRGVDALLALQRGIRGHRRGRQV